MKPAFARAALVASVLVVLTSFVTAAPSSPLPALLVTRSQAPALHARGLSCALRDDCTAGQFCADGTCADKVPDGDACSTDHACLGGICDSATGTCASHRLSAGSKCASSLVCASGNCFHGRCAQKVPVGAFCYKDANCGSARCNSTTGRCAPPPLEKAGGNHLQATLPWELDLADVERLDPGPALSLFYSDHGTHDFEPTSLLVNMRSTANYDAVVLSHSSLVGHVTCSSPDKLTVPFTTRAAYEHVSAAWDRTKPFVLVTHSHGCASAEAEDERTFWLVDRLHFDDGHATVTATASELAIEDALDEIKIDFSQYTEQHVMDTESLLHHDLIGGEANDTSAGAIEERDNDDDLPWLILHPASPVEEGELERRQLALPGSCAAARAGLCGPTFDQQLDDSLGYYDFDADFSGSLAYFAPGLDSYDLGDYVDSDTLAAEDLQRRAKRPPPKKAPARKTTRGSPKGNNSKSKSSLKSFLKKTTSAMKKAVKTVKSAKKSILGTAKKLLKKTPLGKLLSAVDKTWKPSISGKISLGWKYGGATAVSAWGRQPRIWGISGQSGTTKNSGKDAATSARLRKAKGTPRASARATGSVDLFCVNCHVLGKFTYRGTIGFKLLSASITQMTVDYTGSLDANLAFGFEAQARLVAQYRKTLATFPLPGGFAIKNVVTIGPAAVIEASMIFRANAEADILIGAGLKHSFSKHIDLLDSSKSYAKGGKVVMTTVRDVTGAAQASLQMGLPVSLTLGVKLAPIKKKKDIAFTAEPSVTGEVMTATSEDSYTKQGLPECPFGMAYAVTTGIDFSLNLLNLVKKKLGHFDGPDLAKGCVDFGIGNVVLKLPPDSASYCPENNCQCSSNDSTAVCKYRTPGNYNGGLASSFVMPCDGTVNVDITGGMPGWNIPQGYRRPGGHVQGSFTAKSGAKYTVQLGGRGNTQYIDGNSRGGWPNGGNGYGDAGGGGGSSEFISSSGDRLLVAYGGGGNGWNSARGVAGNWPGYFPDLGHLTGSSQGGNGASESVRGNGGGGGGLQGGQGGSGGEGGWAGTNKGDELPGIQWADSQADITVTCS